MAEKYIQFFPYLDIIFPANKKYVATNLSAPGVKVTGGIGGIRHLPCQIPNGIFRKPCNEPVCSGR
jgi:hypothetical protein